MHNSLEVEWQLAATELEFQWNHLPYLEERLNPIWPYCFVGFSKANWNRAGGNVIKEFEPESLKNLLNHVSEPSQIKILETYLDITQTKECAPD